MMWVFFVSKKALKQIFNYCAVSDKELQQIFKALSNHVQLLDLFVFDLIPNFQKSSPEVQEIQFNSILSVFLGLIRLTKKRSLNSWIDDTFLL